MHVQAEIAYKSHSLTTIHASTVWLYSTIHAGFWFLHCHIDPKQLSSPANMNQYCNGDFGDTMDEYASYIKAAYY